MVLSTTLHSMLHLCPTHPLAQASDFLAFLIDIMERDSSIIISVKSNMYFIFYHYFITVFLCISPHTLLINKLLIIPNRVHVCPTKTFPLNDVVGVKTNGSNCFPHLIYGCRGRTRVQIAKRRPRPFRGKFHKLRKKTIFASHVRETNITVSGTVFA